MAIHPEASVHRSAVVEDGARIGAGVSIGAFAYVGAEVELHPGVVVKNHGVVTGWTEVGEGTVVFPTAVVGEVPQDLKYSGERTRLTVGKRCRIREGATLHAGTEGGGGITSVGDDCLLMATTHVAHDCRVGNRVIMANHATLGGHCVIGDDVIIGGLSAVHQWTRIGKGAIIGGMSGVERDVIPYGLVQGDRARLEGLNLVGLKRRGMPREEITALRRAFERLGKGEGTFQDRVRALDEDGATGAVREIVDFILGQSDRSFLTPE